MPLIPRKPERWVFRAAAAITSFAGATGRRRLHVATKLLLAPALQVELLRSARRREVQPEVSLLLAATTGSLLGDWFMYRETYADTPQEATQELHRGATAFGVQQVMLLAVMAARGNRPTLRALAPVAASIGGLAAMETLKTRTSPDPVLLGYGLSLGAMAATAQSDDDRRVRVGGALFLVSDALILIRERLLKDKFSRSVTQFAVLATYATALSLLVRGLTPEVEGHDDC